METEEEPLVMNVLSLGAGVQSSTLALMYASGELGPMPDAAVFADTQGEPRSVYDWLEYLKTQLPYPVYTVSQGNLAKDSLRIRKSKLSGKTYINARIPAFIETEGKSGRALLGRQCTRDYKIAPVMKELRRLLGVKRVKKGSPVLVRLALGISFDEAHRMKPARLPWVQNHWPLVDLKITREGCLDWMLAKGYPTPPRSACRFCPFHSDKEWARLKQHEPKEFEAAVAYERELQAAFLKQDTIKGRVFLHPSMTPLDTATFKEDVKVADLFGNECEGLCGV